MSGNDLIAGVKRAFTPAGMKEFIKSHKYTLAVSGFFSLFGLLMFVFVDLADYRGAAFKLMRDY